MRSRLSRSSVSTAVFDLVRIGLLIAPMVLAAAIVAGLIALAGLVVPWSWYLVIVVAPALYLAWLYMYLIVCGMIVGSLTRRYPKPRYRVAPAGARVQRVVFEDLGALAAIVCYRRLAILHDLPLARAMNGSTIFNHAFLRSYSPSYSIGPGSVNMGLLYDPDLTEIGERVVIGSGAVVCAHSMSTRPDGSVVYVSAPIRIGDRATIGGEARVALGCVIGDDAIVEPGAIVPAMTRIPAGEVWGGNPASFRRTRDDLVPTGAAAAAPVSTSEVRPNGDVQSSGVASPGQDELRRLVLYALDLDDAGAPAEPSSETCPTWDSLGQLAIAAAIFDRYGVVVPEDDVYRLRTLRDVHHAVHGRVAPADAGVPGSPNGASHPVTTDEPSLPDDLELLPLLDHQAATRALAAWPVIGLAGAQPVQVAVAATFTAHALAPALRLWAGAYGFDVGCRFAGYDQVVQTLLDESGPFGTNRAGVNVVLARPEDIWTGSAADTVARIDQIVAALRGFVDAGPLPGELLVGTLPPAVSAVAPLEEADAAWLRHEWQVRVGAVVGVTLFDVASVVERIGTERARDSAGEVVSRAPYSPLLFQELGIELVRHIRSRRRSPAKVVAVDCDNTLWGGVVGEVGLDGIELGEDGPGRAYQLFQRRLKRLKERGILLAVVSRNEEADVLEVFERHRGMVLRPDDVAAWSVNWNHKSENLRALADEMNLGLDSFVFLDDDPAVRAEVAARVPEVHVVPLPSNPAGYTEALERLWLFDGAQATAVDAARTRMMQEEGRRKRESRAPRAWRTSSPASTCASRCARGGPRVGARRPADPAHQPVQPVAQAPHPEEVRALADEASVLVLKAADRFGDYGLVGVAFVRPPDPDGAAEIDTLLMSCRALGRGVEDAFLAGMAALAASQGATSLVAPYAEGKRNAMVLDYLRRSGFAEVEPGRWTLAIADPPRPPAHVTFDGPALAVVGALE